MADIKMEMSDEKIKAGSGKTWSEWRELLDGWGAADKSHTDIARYINEELGVDGWWAQGVTVGYERMIGRREIGQRSDGSYSTSVSKTIAASPEDVWDAVTDEAKRAEWLEDGVATYRTGTKPKSARFDDLEYGMIIAFSIYPTSAGKTSVQLQADKLPDKETGTTWKAGWKPRLQALAKLFG